MLIVILLFLLFLVVGMPVAFSIGIAGVAFFFQHPELPKTIIMQLPVTQTQSFSLLAVPMFIFAGNLMNVSGITSHLIKLASVLTGHMTGGLAQSSVVLSTLMGGVSGSCIADASMEARILGPGMLKRGYTKGYTTNVIAWTSLITATIPPGVGIIIYGTTGNVSVGKLFSAGLMVGILMMIAQMFTVWVTSKRRGYKPERAKRAPAREIFSVIKECIWALLFPILLLVGLRGGIFTPSEVGAFACVYAVLVGLFAYRELTLKKFLEAMGNSVVDIAAIMFIISLSGIFGYGIPFEKIPDLISRLILGLTTNKFVVMAIIYVCLLILGMFIDGSVVILLFTPIFLPLAVKVGWDPVLFGILFCSVVTMGNMTPPVGLAMYAACQILDTPTRDYIKDMWPFVFTVFIFLAVLMLLPDLVLFLPKLIYG